MNANTYHVTCHVKRSYRVRRFTWVTEPPSPHLQRDYIGRYLMGLYLNDERREHIVYAEVKR